MSYNPLEGNDETFNGAITEEIKKSQIINEEIEKTQKMDAINNNDNNTNIIDNIDKNNSDRENQINQKNDILDIDNENKINNKENSTNEVNKSPEELKNDIKNNNKEENEKINENNSKNKDDKIDESKVETEIEKIDESNIEKDNEVLNENSKENENEPEKEEEKKEENKENENENKPEKESTPTGVINEIENNKDENNKKDNKDGNIPIIVVERNDNVGDDETKDKKEDENLAENLEIKGDFHDIFRKNLADTEDTTELKRTLSNLYDKIKILSKDNINTVGIDNKDNENSNKEGVTVKNDELTEEDLNKYYQSFSGTLQHFKLMTIPSAELCNTISNRYHNNINIQEFFEHLEKITTKNAYAINNSLSSLVNLMHGKSSSQLEINSGSSSHVNSLRHPKKALNTADAGLNKNFRNYFKYTKKKFNHNNKVFVSNITNDTIPIPSIILPNIPSQDELPMRDPLSLGIYYHNHQQYDIADYYFTLSSIDNNALGLYLHGMYLKYGHGISGCSPELGFQYLLKSAEASIQSIPTMKKNARMGSTLGTMEDLHGRGSESDLFKLRKIPLMDSRDGME
ncbi:hypothetical protein PIROE2DRAFT_61739 [Piromyces sp. E2]|nr:hypothetical protein PIROE2DRAFT_61739 [Piromyces sp. E2]|eukprot:OUM62669.1 hypothetical protein PIROE2DRAFT_61739 [Piromyces sp. E2]